VYEYIQADSISLGWRD